MMPGAFKFSARLFILLLLAVSILLSLSHPACAETTTPESVRVVILRDAPPLQFYDDKEFRPSGFAVDLFDRVAAEVGLQYTYVYAETWSDMIDMVLNDQADIVASLAVSDARRKQLVFSEVIHSTPISMFVRSENTDIKGLTPGLRVGTTEGSIIVDFLNSQPEKVMILLNKTVPEGVFALLAGRCDALVAADWMVFKELRDANIEDRIDVIDAPLIAIKRAMAVRPGKRALLETLNRGISTLINSPDYRDIYVRWYGHPLSDWSAKRVMILMSILLAATIVVLGGWRMLTARRLNLALRESEGRFRLAMAATSDGLWDWNLEKEQVYFSSNYYRMLGYEPDEFPASYESWKNLVHDHDTPKAMAAMQTHIDNESSPYEIEYRMRTKDGSWKWILDRGEVTGRDANGRALRMIGTHVDITAKKMDEEALKNALQVATEARARVNAILESVADPLIVTDPQQRIVLMNKAAEALLGKPMNQLSGEPINTLLNEPILMGQLGLLTRSGSSEVRNDFVLHHAGLGEMRHVQAQSSSVLSSDGDISGVITLFRDITREKEIDQMKSEFIAIAAHELKTPLTAIIGYSELLLNETMDTPFTTGQRREFLTYILHKGETLERLVEDLLNLGRIESGRAMALDRRRCDLNELILDLIPDHQRVSDLHKIEIDLPADPLIFPVDRIRFEQAIENLLSNARKYSPEGGTINLKLRQDHQCVLLTVSDQGIGMTPEQTSKVFDKFYRADNLDTAVHGLGLGMSIVKNIIEAHGGEVWVESKVGEGSQVSVRLPLADDEG